MVAAGKEGVPGGDEGCPINPDCEEYKPGEPCNANGCSMYFETHPLTYAERTSDQQLRGIDPDTDVKRIA